MWVSVRGGALSSRSEGAVLNGANAAPVETGTGWELLQFLEAELVDEETYRLGGLLRGQQGSEDAASAGALAGSRIVFLTGAERRLALADWERGLDLQWRATCESANADVAWSATLTHQGVGGRQWSPCHLIAT